MKHLICLLLILFCWSETFAIPIKLLTRDSLKKSRYLEEGWLYAPGDDTNRAAKTFPDSNWEITDSELTGAAGKDSTTLPFQGIGWLRYHFSVDTSLVNQPLTFSVAHLGASEVYLDGKLLVRNGTVHPRDSVSYMDPQTRLISFVLTDTGHHVFAVRYASYDYKRIVADYQEEVGFDFKLGRSDIMVENETETLLSLGTIFTFFFGVFAIFAFQHLFLFLYRRKNKAHLYFSIFTFTLAGFFVMTWILYSSENVELKLNLTYVLSGFMCLSFIGFSGLINEMFSRKKLRFKIIAAASVIVFALSLVRLEFHDGEAYLVLMLTVILEAIIVLSRAIYKRLPGSRIVGSGILFFCAFIVFLTSLGFSGGATVSLTGWSGVIAVLLMAGAILSIPISMAVYLARENAGTNKMLESQLEQVKLLSAQALQQEQEKKRLLESRKEELEQLVEQRTAEVMHQKEELELKHDELKEEKNKSDALLRNILPAEVAEELKQTGATEARHYDQVSVLFTDFVDFTKVSEQMSPQELVTELDTCFKAFDDILSSHQIEKIKTIGDAYLAVCGLPNAVEDHAAKTVLAAMEMKNFMEERKKLLGNRTFDIRLGIHSGPVVAGIVGIKKFAYDIWGDTVNTAARMEQSSEAGKINISHMTYELIKDKFICNYRGEIEAKNKGKLRMYYVEAATTELLAEA